MSLLATFRLFKPYFTFERKNKKQWILLGLLVLGNVSQALLLVLLNTLLTHVFGIFSLSLVTYQLLIRSIFEFTFALCVYGLNVYVNARIAEKLTYHLKNKMSKTILAKWFQSKVYYGSSFLGEENSPNVATRLSHDILETNKTLLNLTNNLLNTFFGFCVGICGLWQLSIPLSLTIGSSVLVIPGYMMFAAILYSLLYNFSVDALGRRLENTISKQRKHMDDIEAKVHHIEKYAESIELLNGGQKENKTLLHAFKEGKIYNNLLTKLNAVLAFFFEMNTQLRFFAGTLLNIPKIPISFDGFYLVGDYFYRVVSFFTWKHDNFNEITTLNVLTEKLNSLQEHMAKWETINQQKKLIIDVGDTFEADCLLIQKPDGSPIIIQKKFEFKKSAVTLIEGQSGVGKTTFFRVIAGLWPYASGKLVLPCHRDKIHVISQQLYFPLFASLYEVILYPQTKEVSQHQVAINKLLKDFELDIKEPHQKMNWASTLSGGEQQRIALIRAIIAQPELLLMDEPFSALNANMRANCEQLLRSHLPRATILCIDQHSLLQKKVGKKEIYDYRVSVHDQCLNLEPPPCLSPLAAQPKL